MDHMKRNTGNSFAIGMLLLSASTARPIRDLIFDLKGQRAMRNTRADPILCSGILFASWNFTSPLSTNGNTSILLTWLNNRANRISKPLKLGRHVAQHIQNRAKMGWRGGQDWPSIVNSTDATKKEELPTALPSFIKKSRRHGVNLAIHIKSARFKKWF